MWVCVYKFRKMDEFHVWANMIPTWGPGDYENLREELDFPQPWNGDSHALQGLQAREIPAAISSVPGWSNDHLMEPCCCKSSPVCSRHFLCSAWPYSACVCQDKRPGLKMKPCVVNALYPVFAGGNQTSPLKYFCDSKDGMPTVGLTGLPGPFQCLLPCNSMHHVKMIWTPRALQGTSSPKCSLDHLCPSAGSPIQSSHTSHSIQPVVVWGTESPQGKSFLTFLKLTVLWKSRSLPRW